jgi:hypothetical protein
VKRIVTVLVLSTIFFATIGASQSSSAMAQSTTQAPDTTQPPDTTEVPVETTVPDDGDTSDAPWWILILVGIGILILVVVFATRGSKDKAIATAKVFKLADWEPGRM